VQVQSVLPNGNNRNLSVQLGGQRFTPETNLESSNLQTLPMLVLVNIILLSVQII
jgi:hypothetical protein